MKDPNQQFVKQMTEENREDFETPEELVEVQELLQEELEKGQVRVRMEGQEIMVELLSLVNRQPLSSRTVSGWAGTARAFRNSKENH